MASQVEVEEESGVLRLRAKGRRGMMRALPPQNGLLEPVGANVFSLRPDQGPQSPRAMVVFQDPAPDGRFRYVHLGGRLNPRV
jgi:hypothetical protein